MSFNFLLQIQTTATEAAAGSEISVGDIISESNGGIGWFINLLLFALLGWTIYTVAERYLAMKSATREDSDFLSKIKSFLMDGDVDGARKYCSNSDVPAARIIEKGILLLGNSNEGIYNAMENTKNIEIAQLKRKAGFLTISMGAAPMLGLLATAIGIIRVSIAFQAMANLDLQVLTKDLMPTLFPSILGLITGIIAYAGYKYLMMRIERIDLAMESSKLEFMQVLYGPVK